MNAQSARYFPDAEYQRRRRLVRERAAEQGLDGLLVASPENIYYLTGLDHMGYFAYQLLVFPVAGEPILITRSMERATVRDQVPDVIHVGYSDGTLPPPVPGHEAAGVNPAWAMTAGAPTREMRQRPPPSASAAVHETLRVLAEAGLTRGELAMDQNSTFLPYSIAEGIMAGAPSVHWHDMGSLVDDVRIVQSTEELALTRQAAKVSESMLLSAMAAAGEGINAREIMAAIYDAMFRRGGTYPGFVPLVRSSRHLDHEHGTWEDRALEGGELLFLEMAGCIRRYHAPMGRLVFVERAPAEARSLNDVCVEAMLAAADAIAPGVRAGDVYERWQAVLDRNRLAQYTRHHCGYSVGIGYPPSWSGSGVPVGLRKDSDMRLSQGMVFHLMSWMLRSERGDAFLSDTVVVTETGCEFLTTVDRGVHVR